MNFIPATKLRTRDGSVSLKELATLDHNDNHTGCIQLYGDNVLMYMTGDKSSRVMALVLNDRRLLVGEDTEILTTEGYTRVHRLLLGDSIPCRLPEPLKVTEMRRMVGNVLTYTVFTSEGIVELESGVVVKTGNPMKSISGAEDMLAGFTGRVALDEV